MLPPPDGRPHGPAPDAPHPEQIAFAAVMQSRRPVATYVLLALIVAVFLAELALDATGRVFVLVRLGALDAGLVREGEWWRLASCTFLHGDVVHLAFNGFVLYSLGSLLERVLGTTRFLVLYGVAAFAGSAASLLHAGGGPSVGASGALWGLLATEAVLVFRPAGLLPAVALQRARAGVVQNLVMNVIVSFLPRVDMWAHFGGGAAGALLVGTGLLTRGLPRLSDVLAARAVLPIRTPIALRAAAVVLAIALVGGLATALAKGRAWTVKTGPGPWTEVVVPALDARVQVPAELARPPDLESGEGASEATFGGMFRDAAMVSVRGQWSPFDGDASAGQLDVFVKALEKAPYGGTVVEAPVVRDGSRPGEKLVLVRYRLPNGWLLDAAARVGPRLWWRVDVVRWPDLHPAWAALSREVVERLVPIEAAPGRPTRGREGERMPRGAH